MVTLNDLLDIPGELNWSKIDWISESMNFKADLITWKTIRDNLNGAFEVEDSTYVIEIQPGKWQDYNFINAAFYKLTADGKKHYELTLDTKNPGKVISAIFNGIFEKVKKYHCDALIFSASEDVEKRMSLYNRIANKFRKFYGFVIVVENIKTEKGKCTILINNTVTKDEIDKFIEYIKEHVKE